MTNYKIYPIRFAGKIQSYVVVINGNTFTRTKNGVTVTRNDYTHTINNSWYPDFKSEEEVFKYFE